ncbi:RsmE family RNA methyltransferase [Melioribacter sp. OK-6-Me]|uniref:RsmE family RNA methyltransferase n=1 Tax=unclassified Melioribacter TaxID=2627329 RepID=UPI003EDAA605
MKDSYLTDVELYYSEIVETDNSLILTSDESHHLINVMRHKIGDEIFVTDGNGNIYLTTISNISKREVSVDIKQKYSYPNILKNITFCIPRLRNSERFEFALEKSIELGITNFIIFESERTVARGEKLTRWNKIALAAMKQSLRCWKPIINYFESLNEIIIHGEIVVFDQKGNIPLEDFINNNFDLNRNYSFVFGPEGGFEKREIDRLGNTIILRLTENRLRSETAIISAAAVLATAIR